MCFWIRALSTQQGGYVRATNLIIIIIIIHVVEEFKKYGNQPTKLSSQL